MSWDAFQWNNAGAWTDITDWTATFSTSAVFRFSFTVTDSSGDLNQVHLLARLGNVERVLWSRHFGLVSHVSYTVEFSVPTEGDWDIVVQAKDWKDNITEQVIYASGNQTLKIRAPGSTKAAIPTANPRGGAYSTFPQSVALACSTAGATIHYQLKNGTLPYDAGWSTYATAANVQSNQRLYFYASKSGLTDSDVGYESYTQSYGGGGGGGGCFLAGTMITMADGSQRAIEQMKAGDELATYVLPGLTRDPYAWRRYVVGRDVLIAPRPATTHVLRVIRNRFHYYYRINGQLHATYEHPLLAIRDGLCCFITASGLRVGDLLFRTGAWEPVNAIEKVCGEIVTFNLDTDPVDMFLADGYLAHNTTHKT